MEYKEYEFSPCSYGGTMTEEEYIRMIDILEDFCPDRICEFGSGQSTLVFERFCKYHNKEMVSIEHDEAYKRENTVMLPMVEYTEINADGSIYGDCNKYNGFEDWLKKQDKFDFVLVDGPVGCAFREMYKYSRVQILSFVILDKLSDNSIVLYHDSERGNAKTTLEEFERLLLEKGFKFKKELINENNTRELTIYNIEKQ